MLLALVNGGALLDYRTKDGTTAMHRAVQADNYEAVKTLLGKLCLSTEPLIYWDYNILFYTSIDDVLIPGNALGLERKR